MRKYLLLIAITILAISCSVTISDEPTYSLRDVIVNVSDRLGGHIFLSDAEEGNLSISGIGNEISAALDGIDPSFSVIWYLDGQEDGRVRGSEVHIFQNIPPGTHQITAAVFGDGEYEIGSISVLITVNHINDPVIEPREENNA